MKKRIFLVLLMITTLVFVACGQKQNSKVTRIYHKTIEVKIIDIDYKGRYGPTHYWHVTVVSEEYNLEETFTLKACGLNGDPYTNEIYNGDIKVGSIVKAELISKVTDGKVVSRYIDELVE